MNQPHSNLMKRIEKVWPVFVQDCKEDEVVLFVSHGGYVSHLIKHLLNNNLAVVADEASFDFSRHPPNTSITQIDVSSKSGRGVITLFGETPHLQ